MRLLPQRPVWNGAITFNAAWNVDQMHCIAFVQLNGGAKDMPARRARRPGLDAAAIRD